MKRYKDLSGLQFSNLTVLKLNGRNDKGFLLWSCVCKCGGKIDVTANHLTSGNTRSCGCLRKVPRSVNSKYQKYIGTKIGKLLILDFGNPNKFGQKTFLVCCDCGVKKEVLITKLLSKRTVSCGCYRIEVVKSMTGEKHHNWNPDKSVEEKNKDATQRRHKEWDSVKWRKAVFQRDNFQCQLCENKRNLNGHHLNCWSLFKDQRYDVENGITLCDVCHRSFHKKYGLKCTKEQFEEFKGKHGKYS